MNTLKYFFKWTNISLGIALLSGSASALFLVALRWCTSYRIRNEWLIFGLPLGGFVITFLYHHFTKISNQGNNLILKEIYKCSKILPILMAPLVLLGTLVTHLFGGSAGREGTALQMSASLSDQISKYFKFDKTDRKILLIASISAGFSSVFGTPFTGFIFALELIFNKKIDYKMIYPVFVSSILADIVTSKLWRVGHTSYHFEMTNIHWNYFLYLIPLGIIFGLFSRLFIDGISLWKKLMFIISKKEIIHPIIGGLIVIGLYFLIDSKKYLGLGLSTISEAFTTILPFKDSILKLIFTAITLGSTYKGGEVTPLFFIGATLGSALAIVIPLKLTILAGIGFVSVFAGATKTPFACTIMAMELFNPSMGIYTITPCLIAANIAKNKYIYYTKIK